MTTRLIPVPKWNEYHAWPPVGGLRHLIWFQKKNGFDKVIKRIGRRVLIDEAAFFQWAETQEPKGEMQFSLKDAKEKLGEEIFNHYQNVENKSRTYNALLMALKDLHDDIQGRIDDGQSFNPGTLVALEDARIAIEKAESL